jgi:hypothetical protein
MERKRGAPRLAFEFFPRRSPCSEAAVRFGHIVKCARIWHRARSALGEKA